MGTVVAQLSADPGFVPAGLAKPRLLLGLGSHPSRNGHSAQVLAAQLRTSLGRAPEQSRHLRRIARRTVALVVMPAPPSRIPKA
jgi:hypothetical protein